MMDDQQKEKAARKLCELRGRNPDELIAHGADPDSSGVVPAICLYSPAWKLALKEIEYNEMLKNAIED